jgi:hypothetical protein
MRLRRHCQRLAKVETLLIALSLEAALPRCPDNAARELNLTPNGRWTEARWLRLGDKFLTRTGVSATVVGLTIRMERVQVYNLQVKNLQLYAIGEHGVLVHNSAFNGVSRNSRDYKGATWVYEIFDKKIGVTSVPPSKNGLYPRVQRQLDPDDDWRIIREFDNRNDALTFEEFMIKWRTQGGYDTLPGNIRHSQCR